MNHLKTTPAILNPSPNNALVRQAEAFIQESLDIKINEFHDITMDVQLEIDCTTLEEGAPEAWKFELLRKSDGTWVITSKSRLGAPR